MLRSCKVLFKCYLFLSVGTWFCFHLHLVLYLCKSVCRAAIARGAQPGSQGRGACLAMLRCRQVAQPTLCNVCICSKALWSCRRTTAPRTTTQRCLRTGKEFSIGVQEELLVPLLLTYFSARYRAENIEMPCGIYPIH